MKFLSKWSMGALTLAVLGWALWRRRVRAKQLSGPMHGPYVLDGPRMVLAVRSQVSLAQKAHPLTSYLKAEDRGLFLSAPQYDATAFLTGAYWLAVGARLTGSATLLSKARTYLRKGETTFAIPGSSFMTSNIAHILDGAADALRPFSSDSHVAALLAAVTNQAQADVIETRRRQAVEQDPVAQAGETARAAGEDSLDLLNAGLLWVRDGLGLKRPDGTQPPWWRKWIVRGAVGLGAIIALRVAFAPHYNAAKAMIGKTAGMARALLPSKPAPKALPAPTPAEVA